MRRSRRTVRRLHPAPLPGIRYAWCGRLLAAALCRLVRSLAQVSLFMHLAYHIYPYTQRPGSPVAVRASLPSDLRPANSGMCAHVSVLHDGLPHRTGGSRICFAPGGCLANERLVQPILPHSAVRPSFGFAPALCHVCRSSTWLENCLPARGLCTGHTSVWDATHNPCSVTQRGRGRRARVWRGRDLRARGQEQGLDQGPRLQGEHSRPSALLLSRDWSSAVRSSDPFVTSMCLFSQQ